MAILNLLSNNENKEKVIVDLEQTTRRTNKT